MQRPEKGQHGVVVPLRNGIELVVVTTGAAQGLTKKRLSDRVELLVCNLHALIEAFGNPNGFNADSDVHCPCRLQALR
jgi:hypothetical protein